MRVSSGYLDTNVVIHSLTNDTLATECSQFIELLQRGEITAVLDVTVLHELTYTISRYRKEYTRADIAQFLLWLVDLESVSCDRPLFKYALERWGVSDNLGFVDAYLIARASQEGVPIYSKNVKHLGGFGVTVPDPLPGTATN
jgi:predicted nucleic acid-binding protein